MEEKVVNPGKPDLGAPSLPLAPAHALRMTGDAHDGIAMLSHLFALAAGSRGYHLYSVPEYPAEIRLMPTPLQAFIQVPWPLRPTMSRSMTAPVSSLR